MTLEEQRQAAIITYVNLMRIKAHETGQNKELDYQIKIAKVMLQNFGIDFSELEYQSVPEVNLGQIYRKVGRADDGNDGVAANDFTCYFAHLLHLYSVLLPKAFTP